MFLCYYFEQEIHTNPDLFASPHLHIDTFIDGVGRIDLKIEKSGIAACVFSKSELLFIRLNGHRAVPRLETFIENETSRKINEVKGAIGKQYFNEWVTANVPQFEPHTSEAD